MSTMNSVLRFACCGSHRAADLDDREREPQAEKPHAGTTSEHQCYPKDESEELLTQKLEEPQAEKPHAGTTSEHQCYPKDESDELLTKNLKDFADHLEEYLKNQKRKRQSEAELLRKVAQLEQQNAAVVQQENQENISLPEEIVETKQLNAELDETSQQLDENNQQNAGECESKLRKELLDFSIKLGHYRSNVPKIAGLVLQIESLEKMYTETEQNNAAHTKQLEEEIENWKYERAKCSMELLEQEQKNKDAESQFEKQLEQWNQGTAEQLTEKLNKHLEKQNRIFNENENKNKIQQQVVRATQIRELRRLKYRSEENNRLLKSLTRTASQDATQGEGAHVKRIERIYTDLTEQLLAKYVAAEMFKYQALSINELDNIQHCRTNSRAAEILLQIVMQSRRREVYECFMEAVRRSGQEHVYKLIAYSDFDLDKHHCKIIQQYYLFLLDKLDTKTTRLLAILHDDEVLSSIEKEEIEAEWTQTRQIEKLLSLLSRKTPEQFQLFLKALDNSVQTHIADRIIGRQAFIDSCPRYAVSPCAQSETLKQLVVVGIAHCDQKLFTVCLNTNKIRIFGSNDEHSGSITLKKMHRPTDIVSCTETRQLYVAGESRDWFSRRIRSRPSYCCVWRVSLDGRQVVKLLQHETTESRIKSHTLSVTSRRLLVTSRSTKELILAGADGVELKRIPLPKMGELRHAVETSRETIILCHLTPQPRVCEVDTVGGELHVYSDPQQLSSPAYLSLDSYDRVFVADDNKNCILLLNILLNMEVVLLDKQQHQLTQPRRLCYTQQTGQLAVCGRDVLLFTLSVKSRAGGESAAENQSPDGESSESSH